MSPIPPPPNAGPRAGSKLALVIEMLAKPEGAIDRRAHQRDGLAVPHRSGSPDRAAQARFRH